MDKRNKVDSRQNWCRRVRKIATVGVGGRSVEESLDSWQKWRRRGDNTIIVSRRKWCTRGGRTATVSIEGCRVVDWLNSDLQLSRRGDKTNINSNLAKSRRGDKTNLASRRKWCTRGGRTATVSVGWRSSVGGSLVVDWLILDLQCRRGDKTHIKSNLMKRR
jgi:hypothetical protein